MNAEDVAAMKRELISLIPVIQNSDMFYGVTVCRWLDYNDNSGKRPPGLHNPECFAVRYLGAPSRPPCL